MYGGSLQGLQLDVPIIYRGTFGTGMFQCLYQPGVAHWAMLPSTLEWQVAALLLGLAGVLVGPSGWILGAGMLGLSLLVAALAGGPGPPGPDPPTHGAPDSSSPRSAMPSRSSGPGRGIGPGCPRNAHPGSIRRRRRPSGSGCR